MVKINLKQNFTRIVRTLEDRGMKPTNISKGIGYTTTVQLNNILDGESLPSTKAIIGLVENLNVNPIYLFLGKGDIFLTDEVEVDKLRKENQELIQKHKVAEITIGEFKEVIAKLEKRNADLIDISAAAIQYHKGQKVDEQTSKDSKEIDNVIVMKVLKQLGLMNPDETEVNISKIKSSLKRKQE
jgi:hypothetical protein